MVLDFPTSPTDGQYYSGFTYNTAQGVWRAVDPSTLSGLSDVETDRYTSRVGYPSSVLTYDGTMWAGRNTRYLLDVITYFADGTFDLANYPTANFLFIRAQAGGGGGGGAVATTSTQNCVGSSGGAGEYVELLWDVRGTQLYDYQVANGQSLDKMYVPTYPVSVVIGAGGAGGAGATGTSGGDTYFAYADPGAAAVYVAGAEGGTAGAVGAALATNRSVNGGAGGFNPAPAGDIDFITSTSPGGYGKTVWALGATTVAVAQSGKGGESINSTGAKEAFVNAAGGTNGNNAGGYGGGGSGAINTGTNAGTRTGGNGSSGFLIVEVYG